MPFLSLLFLFCSALIISRVLCADVVPTEVAPSSSARSDANKQQREIVQILKFQIVKQDLLFLCLRQMHTKPTTSETRTTTKSTMRTMNQICSYTFFRPPASAAPEAENNNNNNNNNNSNKLHHKRTVVKGAVSATPLFLFTSGNDELNCSKEAPKNT